jgi:hypothetical protein
MNQLVTHGGPAGDNHFRGQHRFPHCHVYNGLLGEFDSCGGVTIAVCLSSCARALQPTRTPTVTPTQAPTACSALYSASTPSQLAQALSTVTTRGCNATVAITAAGSYRLNQAYTIKTAVLLTAASAPGAVTLLPAAANTRHFVVETARGNLTVVGLRWRMLTSGRQSRGL